MLFPGTSKSLALQVSQDPEINAILNNPARPTAPMGLVASLSSLPQTPAMTSSLVRESVVDPSVSFARSLARTSAHSSSLDITAPGSLVCVFIAVPVIHDVVFL